MIEIVFGESACGSLKIAQTYGKGKYRGSAVSIFMRHEDGSVPSSDEMKKAQLQAQEQERIAWENTPYAKCDSIIDNEIAAKLKKCNVTTLITVGKLIDVLIDQQEMIKKAELD